MADDRCDLLCLDLDKAEELRGQRIDPATLGRIARQAQALADPTRLDLAVSLQRAGELCVCDLAWISGRSQNLVSHHLRALKAAELAEACEALLEVRPGACPVSLLGCGHPE